MGNSSTKESRSTPVNPTRPASSRHPSAGTTAATRHAHSASLSDGLPIIYSTRGPRSNQSDVPFLRFGDSSDRDGAPLEPRKETRQEREARKLEKERVARLKERERSVREEGVDGGYLVTLGTYTGPEDFNKGIVRQLMIERRLAPFWKGLNDHSDSWTEHQLVAAARGLPIPAADEIPPEDSPHFTTNFQVLPESSDAGPSGINIMSKSASQYSGTSSNLSASQPGHHQASSSVPTISQSSLSPLFRGRSKTLASLTSSSKPQADFALPEIQLPKDPLVNGQPIEAYLYKDAAECPICFLYYPPYLNKTRCCDQSICSECFVQIKRPDPHPEHAEPNTPSQAADSETDTRSPESDGQLISEPASCPFCVQPEFGVTYESPPFRRGLTYTVQSNPLARTNSAMSSNSSLSSANTGIATPSATSGRRRAHSISANAPTVITTDKVRPDWAKKLSDARSQAARRAAAATALHTAAYLMGPPGTQDTTWLSRRRRGNTDLGPNRLPEGFGIGSMGYLLAALEGQGSSRAGGANPDLFPGRQSSRRTRVDDLEDMMMMEAIRLSLAAEEDRKKKEEKEAAKQAKKDEKKNVKELKKAEKTAKKSGLYRTESNDSGSMLGTSPHFSFVEEPQPEEGKGKAKVLPQATQNYVGFNPLSEPTSTLNSGNFQDETLRSSSQSLSPPAEPQANIFGTSPAQGSHLRHMSNASSLDSVASEAPPMTTPTATGESLKATSQLPLTGEQQAEFPTSASSIAAAPRNVNADVEQALNFSNLAEIIDRGDAENTKHLRQHEESERAFGSENKQTSRNASNPNPLGYEEHDSGNSDDTADEDTIERTTQPANEDLGVDDNKDYGATDVSERPVERGIIR